MATMISEVYDAFIEAGATQDKARKAAEAVADFDKKTASLKSESVGEFKRVDERFNQVDHRFNQVDQRFTKIEADLNLVKWMLGFVLAGVSALVVRGLFG